ncbi:MULTISPECIES: Arc family DNA-binding protein [Acinetobacter]|uniref:Arc family DNA-binding protein n=1 Tax=Acinetobacter TaxID=469 RepID=UPI001D0D9390|nr:MULTISPECIES: Arc family DNA-binding protein [Acinetobacter]
MGILILQYMVMSENQRDPQYKLRWSEDLRQKIAQSAKEHNRSMNAEIVARLEQSFNKVNTHETEMYLMNVMVKEQQKQIDQLQEMVKQLVFRDRKLED